MNVIWAPWRIKYITGEKQEGCIFCEKPKDMEDEKNLILHRGETAFIIMNLYPYSNGHLMVVPYKHTRELSKLSDTERAELMNLTVKCVDLLEIMEPDGFNIGMNLGRTAGAGIDDHIHFHIVPRWDGDTNFMPVIADTKVMPEHIIDTYRKLEKQLNT